MQQTFILIKAQQIIIRLDADQIGTKGTIGGAVGLSVGYVIKYYLDKKYVFTDGIL